MVQLSSGWSVQVERGPDWVFMKLDPDVNRMESNGLADEIWTVLEKHLTYRLILEMEGVRTLASQLIGQLMLLQKRIYAHGGLLRLCGVSHGCQDALMISRLRSYLPLYGNRHEALLGRPDKPR